MLFRWRKAATNKSPPPALHLIPIGMAAVRTLWQAFAHFRNYNRLGIICTLHTDISSLRRLIARLVLVLITQQITTFLVVIIPHRNSGEQFHKNLSAVPITLCSVGSCLLFGLCWGKYTSTGHGFMRTKRKRDRSVNL